MGYKAKNTMYVAGSTSVLYEGASKQAYIDYFKLNG